MPGLLSETSYLLSPFGHPIEMSRMRTTLIIARAQQIAKLFSLMILCWIPVDAMFLPWPLWEQLAFERLIAAMAFLALGLVETKPKLDQALVLLGGVYLLVLTFLFCVIYWIRIQAADTSFSSYAAIYYFSPFVLAAGIGFFPLTILEVLPLLILPIVGIMFLYASFFHENLGIQLDYSIFWILLLTLITSAIASVSQIGFVLELFHNTAYDKLTGLYLRKMGEATLSQQIAAALRGNNTYSILLMDIDHFKDINDNYGHEAGDDVLNNVGKQLKLILRQQDVAVRWGGEEFLIALPNTDKNQAENFLKRFAAKGLGINTNGAPITASFGIAEIKTDDIQQLPALVALADERLYAAKRAGRNCYVAENSASPWLKLA